MSHEVTLQIARPRAVAAVRAHLSYGQVPQKFAQYLDQVYAAARQHALSLDGQNIFVYFPRGDGTADIDFGVGARAPFEPLGNVKYSQLPTGEVAGATHWGAYTGLGGAHQDIIAWCKAQQRVLAGPSWEVYGHWSEDPSRVRTDIYYLLEPPA